MSDQGNENELAELLSEVRALRATLEELKAGSGAAALPPNYAVLARSASALQRNYNVLVRQTQPFEDVEATAEIAAARPPSYAVLVRAAIPDFEEDPARGE